MCVCVCRVFQKMLYATPSPQRKKEPTTGPNKLRLFLKRSSEPLLNLKIATEKVIHLTSIHIRNDEKMNE